MCRHLAYLGAPIAIDTLLFDAPHALVEQAEAPRLQTATPDNPDGWGVAWYVEREPGARRYRTTTRMWDYTGYRAMHGGATSVAVLAAARAASPGLVLDVTGNAPFVDGRWTFSLNGTVPGFRDGVGDELRARVSARRASALEGDTDSEVLFALVLDRVDEGASPRDAVADVARTTYARAGGRINLLLTDGCTVAGTAIGNSLFVHHDDGALLVASEPLDDRPGWKRVPDGSAVHGSACGYEVEPVVVR